MFNEQNDIDPVKVAYERYKKMSHEEHEKMMQEMDTENIEPNEHDMAGYNIWKRDGKA